MSRLTHLDAEGNAHMVDVSDKHITSRSATAKAVVEMLPDTLTLILEGKAKKGDVIATARIAGISTYSAEFLHKPLSIKNKLLQQFSLNIAAVLKPSHLSLEPLGRLYRLLAPLHQALQFNDPKGIYAQCMIEYY